MSFEGVVKVRFGEEVDTDSYKALIKLDNRSNGITGYDNNGDPIYKTSFQPGESAIFQAHFSSNVHIDAIGITDGDLETLSSVIREIESDNIFESRVEGSEDTFILPVEPLSKEVEFYGKEGTLTEEQLPGSLVRYKGDIASTPFHAKFTNTYSTILYKLTCPDYTLDDDESWPITVVFYATISED